jgi:hypothetical protein
VLPESMFAPCLDLSNALHRLDRSLHQFAVIAYGDVPPLLEVNGRVLNVRINQLLYRKNKKGTNDRHLLARRLTERFRPANFSRIALHPGDGVSMIRSRICDMPLLKVFMTSRMNNIQNKNLRGKCRRTWTCRNGRPLRRYGRRRFLRSG